MLVSNVARYFERQAARSKLIIALHKVLAVFGLGVSGSCVQHWRRELHTKSGIIMPKMTKRKPRQQKPSPYVKESSNAPPSIAIGKSVNNIPADIIEKLTKEYQKQSNVAFAKWSKHYMKDHFEYFGLKAPERRQIEKNVFSGYQLDLPTTLTLLEELWDRTEREFQYCGIDLARREVKLLFGNSAQDCEKSLQAIQSLITRKSWWDTVDMLASGVVGRLVAKHPDVLLSTMDEWVASDNMWLRRTALIYQLNYKKDTDKTRLFRYCLLLCDEKEFFIQKAIGWSLREYHKHQPADVVQFVNDNMHQLAKLSVREALKHAK